MMIQKIEQIGPFKSLAICMACWSVWVVALAFYGVIK